MTDYELEIVFRQLKEYSTLYKDMMHNYGALMKRLVDEDMRKSGNFALKKPRVAGMFVLLYDLLYFLRCMFCSAALLYANITPMYTNISISL